MIRFFMSLVVMMIIILPVIAYEKNNKIVIYKGLHIPIKFVEKVYLDNHNDGDIIDIAVSEDTGVDGLKIFKKDCKGKAVLSVKNDEWNIDSGKLFDVDGNEYPIEIKGFHLKDFMDDDEYIVPQGYVIDAFVKEKRFK